MNNKLYKYLEWNKQYIYNTVYMFSFLPKWPFLGWVFFSLKIFLFLERWEGK